jgi:DNA-binding GntR family transcriptional regulator
MRIAELIHGQMHLLVAKAAYTPGRFRGAHMEHEAVMRCIRDHKPQAAEEAMREHIRAAKVALMKAAQAASHAQQPASNKDPARQA